MGKITSALLGIFTSALTFTRGFAVQSLKLGLSVFLSPGQIEHIVMVMSGGTEGGLSPHWIVFEDRAEDVGGGGGDGGALAIGTHMTRDLSPVELDRMAQVRLVADGVTAAMRAAQIARTDEVHFVQIKCPLLAAERIASVGGNVATIEPMKSMGLSRGASALGIAMALGELSADQVSDAKIGTDLSLYPGRASCSAGIEVMACEILG